MSDSVDSFARGFGDVPLANIEDRPRTPCYRYPEAETGPRLYSPLLHEDERGNPVTSTARGVATR